MSGAVMRVAAYCRVSTDQRDQANSFASQQRYFRRYISARPDWALYEIYADEGTTGTSTKKRAAFHRMIEDARAGRFRLILTKEISRFARNTLDSIAYIRELKALGVGVLFLNDQMNTLQERSEFILTIKASQAQEESRATSSRVKWGQMRQMEQGVVFGRSLLGYDLQNGQLTVNPAGAEVVRLIFHKYVREGKGLAAIARELEEAGIRPLRGGQRWQTAVLRKILRNEKYCGDLRQKKTYTPDYLTHRRCINRGEEPFVFLQDHHPPIVSRPLWQEAQARLDRQRRSWEQPTGRSAVHPLSGKLRCGGCGSALVARSRTRRDGSRYLVWSCGRAVRLGREGCPLGWQLRDDFLHALLRQAVGSLPLDRARLYSSLEALLAEGLSRAESEAAAEGRRLARRAEELRRKKLAALDAYLSGSLSQGDWRLASAHYDSQLAALERPPDGEALSLPRRPGWQPRAEALLAGTAEDAPAFYAGLVERMTVYPDRRLELALRGMPECWRFRLSGGRSEG